jgi:cell division protein FtsA
MMNMVKKDDTLNMKGITGDGDRIVDKMLLAEVIEERFREIFRLINKDIENSGKKQSCAAGMVLTGGSSLMQGIAMLAEDELKIPVRVGVPMGIVGLNELVESPIYATGVGLVKYGSDSDEHTAFLKNANPENTGKIVLRNLKSLVNDFFKLF